MSWWEVIWNIPWKAWLQPILSWGIFVLLCYTVMICIVSILSSQAIHNERMNFPLLRVPQMLEQAFDENRLGHFMTNRFLVAGILVSATLHVFNGLHFYFPSVPQIPTLILAGP
jgi:ABC-type transport system involved in multi-copper enzyme maturation permease subunit